MTEDSTRMKSMFARPRSVKTARSCPPSTTSGAATVSALDAVTACLDALRQVDAETNAVAAFEDERALADARPARRGVRGDADPSVRSTGCRSP